MKEINKPPNEPGTWLTVWYDGACPICSTEMQALKQADVEDAIEFIDAHDASVATDMALCADGVCAADLMTTLHVRDAMGQWHHGVDGIALLYATVGMPWVAALFGSRFSRPVSSRLYPWVVRHRYQLTRWLGWALPAASKAGINASR